MTKALVTGGAGFIGSNTVDLLAEEGYDVIVVDDLSTGKKGNLNQKAKFYMADIRKPGLGKVFEQVKPDVVVHLAAHIDVRKSVRDPGYDADINVRGSINLLESCRKHKVKKIVYASSGGAIYGEPQYNPVDENHPVRPLCPYGTSKYAAEKYVEMYGALYDMDYSIMRYGNVYGPRQDPLGEAGVVAIFAGLISKGKRPVIFGDGKQTRDFCFVRDVAEANLKALEENGKAKIYNIGSGVETSVNKMVEMLTKVTGVDLTPKQGKPVPGEVRHIFLDVSLARKELNWGPKTGLKEGLDATWRWMKDA